MQFAAVRRVRLDPAVAAALQATGSDELLDGCATWRVGGTQKVYGYWRLLRAKVGQRGWNTRRRQQLHQAVRCHQWAYWAGPGAD
eukprot:10945346-Alexandrium_andersonii.AAC.1